MIVDLLLVAGGLVALVIGGDVLVRGAVGVAVRAGLSPFVIGLTLVGFGTSVPELMTSMIAAHDGLPGIALGNVVGSNIANILLILGLAALIAPVPAQALVRRDGLVMIGVSLLCAGLILMGDIGRLAGIACLILLLAYLLITLRLGGADVDVDVPVERAPIWRAIVLFLVGLTGVMLGARFLVDGASEIARAFNVSNAVIGLTIVAVGTSLPELVTTVVAARKGEGEIAVGNIIGSNIFNVLGILGMTSAVFPLAVPAEMAGPTLWLFLGAAIAPAAIAAWRGALTRGVGLVFVAAYAAYTVTLII